MILRMLTQNKLGVRPPFFFTSCQESVFRSLQKTDELFVYEGLPHPMRENSYFEKEKNRKDVMEIDGHWFYQPKVKASLP